MNWSPSKYPLIINPYDSFMKKHLQHYGYFTGRNVAIARFGYEPKRGVKNEESDDSDSDSDNDSENSTNRAKNKIDWKTKAKCHELKIDNYKWWLKDNALFNMGLKDGEYQREPRWPIEMQVLPDKIKHIDTAFPQAEPFYAKTGFEETPMCILNESKAKTVFYYNPINCGYFIRSRVGGNRDGCQKISADIPEIELESTLMFESRFESGNLMKAVKISDREYELYMRYDLYTNRHTQWFYFQIKNAKPDIEYRFTICNFLKNDSLYNGGMKPVMYSELDAKTKGIGWRRYGKDIKYYRNNIRSEDDNGVNRSLYSLTWTCKFPNANDTYYFAHCYPYTYSDLQDYVREIQEDPVKSKYCKVKVLCRTLAENLVYLITITNPANTDQENANKKGVVISARVHPGETNSSWMMKGFLDFLLGSSGDAKLLRDNFVFKMIPMLNPDGVIIGNYRCSLTGRDLNRNYKTVLKEAFPSIWHTREMVKKFMEEREVVLYCDLHGHSRKNNVFIYGCHNNGTPKRRFQEHIFPIILSRNAKDQFSYKSCKFKIQKSKQGTGRVVMWNLGIMNSFTMEATFNGSTLNAKAGLHFSQRDLEQLGYLFLDSLLDYCDPDQTKCKNILNEVEMSMREQLRSKLESQGIKFDDINLIDDFDSFNFNFDDEQDESSAASDSSGDDGLPLHLERFAKLRQRKKRKVKTRKTTIQPSEKPCKSQKEKKTGITAPTVVSASKEKETLLKDQEKKLLRPLVSQNQGSSIQIQQINHHHHHYPKSAKPSAPTGIPTFTHDRAEERAAASKKSNQNEIDGNTDQHLLSFRYTLPNDLQFPGSFNPHNHLCEHHRKKLSDLFLIRHLSNDDNKSDGDASDDEADDADLNDETQFPINDTNSSIKRRPTLEEYVNKHVFTNRSESTNNIVGRKHRRTKTSQPSLGTHSISRLQTKNNNDSHDLDNNNNDTTNNNYRHIEHHHRNALDFMPKYVIKQLEKKTVLIPQYTGMFAKNLIDNTNESQISSSNNNNNNNNTNNNKELIRGRNLSKSTNNKHAFLIQKQTNLNLSVQSTPIIQQQLIQQQQRININTSKLTNQNNETISSATTNTTNHTTAPVLTTTINNNNNNSNNTNSTFAKINEEFLNSLANNNNITNNNSLFSSAFVSMNPNNIQLKSQYDKITSRANSGMAINISTISTNSKTLTNNLASINNKK